MEHTSIKKLLTLIVVAVVVVVGALVLANVKKKDKEVAKIQGTQNSPEGVKVSHVDLAKASTPKEKIPQGLPSGIPLETNNVRESYSAEYQDLNAIQYTVVFTTNSSVAEKFQEYVTYMKSQGYQITHQDKDAAVKYVYGSKDNDDLSVVISRQGESTQVQLTYLDRQ